LSAVCGYTTTVGKHAVLQINVFYSKMNAAGAFKHQFTVSARSRGYEHYTEENLKERKYNAQVTNLQ
jgi:hypothetical protein